MRDVFPKNGLKMPRWVVAAVNAGMTPREISEFLDANPETVEQIMRRRRYSLIPGRRPPAKPKAMKKGRRFTTKVKTGKKAAEAFKRGTGPENQAMGGRSQWLG